MNLRLVDAGWDMELDTALLEDRSRVRIVSPFIKKRAAERLLKRGKPQSIQVITRFNLDDFSNGVSDIAALELLLDAGAQIRGIRHLHSKMYLFGGSRAIVTSANLTESALLRNHEFGFIAQDADTVSYCHKYFDNLWSRAGIDLSETRLTEWAQKVKSHLVTRSKVVSTGGLGDEGTDVEACTAPFIFPSWIAEAEQGFVKFFGEGGNRANRNMSILELVESSGCHWACTYPKGKRPRQVLDGAVMFMSRLASDPNDILIYGRAVGLHHEPGRDDASDSDKRVRPWKDKWPHYIRVHHPEFIGGNLSNGVSLNEVMDELGSNTFLPTQRNAGRGQGNIDPRRAYMQQAAVELSPQAIVWLNGRLQRAYAQYGNLSPLTLEQLDWPTESSIGLRER